MKGKRDAIVALAPSGFNVGSIAKRLNVHRTSVYRIKKFSSKGSVDDEPRSGRPRSSRTKDLVKSVKVKISRNPRRSLKKMAAEAGISPTSMRRLVHEDLKMSSFRTVKRHHLTEDQMTKRRERSKVLLEKLRSGTRTGEVVFSDEKIFTVEAAHNRKNDLVIGASAKSIPDEYRTVTRQQKPASVMVWSAVSKTWKSPLILVQEGVKVTAARYISEILKPMEKAANAHFGERKWTFQQDGAPAHTANITQEWCKAHLPGFWPKEMWPPSSPDLNPMDYSIWSILEANACATRHSSVDGLKASLKRAWAALSQKTVRAAVGGLYRRLEDVVAAEGGHIE